MFKMCFYLALQFRIVVSKKTRVGVLQLRQFFPERKKEKQIFTIQYTVHQISGVVLLQYGRSVNEIQQQQITTVKHLTSEQKLSITAVFHDYGDPKVLTYFFLILCTEDETMKLNLLSNDLL